MKLYCPLSFRGRIFVVVLGRTYQYSGDTPGSTLRNNSGGLAAPYGDAEDQIQFGCLQGKCPPRCHITPALPRPFLNDPWGGF